MNRLEHLKALSDKEVNQWLDKQRASWEIAIENSGIDGNIGSLVRAHNLLAGGGVNIIGRARWNRRVSMGTYLYEPISYYKTAAEWKAANPERKLISVEQDPNLPPFDDYLFDDATYLLGHDCVGLSPEIIKDVDFRCGPPKGWSRFAGPGLLGSILMYALRRQAVAKDKTDFFLSPEKFQDTKPENKIQKSSKKITFTTKNKDNPFWLKDWDKMPRKDQKEELKMDWWVEQSWAPDHDWWAWAPNLSYPLNRALLYRFCQSAKFRGIVCPHASEQVGERNWKHLDTEQAILFFKKNGYTIFGLEHDGDNIMQKQFPKKGVLLVGNEQTGMGGYEDFVEKTITLPQYGSGRSFSAPLAGGMAMYAIASQTK